MVTPAGIRIIVLSRTIETEKDDIAAVAGVASGFICGLRRRNGAKANETLDRDRCQAAETRVALLMHRAFLLSLVTRNPGNGSRFSLTLTIEK